MSTLKYLAGPDLMTVTLGADYTAGDGQMTLTAGQGARLPASGDFWIRPTSGTSRVFKVTANAADVLTTAIVAAYGADDQNYPSGTEFKWSLTVEALDQLRADISQSGLYGSLPAGEKKGQLYFPTDSFYEALHYDGAAWESFLVGRKVSPFVPGDYAWVNQGGASATAVGAATLLTAPADASSNLRILKKAAPGTPYTVDLDMLAIVTNANYQNCGFVWRESATGKLQTLGYYYNVGQKISRLDWASATSAAGSSTDYTTALNVQYQRIRIRAEADGTNLKGYFYWGSIYPVQVFTELKNAHFTTAPDEIGIYANSLNVSAGISILVLGFTVG